MGETRVVDVLVFGKRRQRRRVAAPQPPRRRIVEEFGYWCDGQWKKGVLSYSLFGATVCVCMHICVCRVCLGATELIFISSIN